MNSQFGGQVLIMTEMQHFYLRHDAPLLGIDTALWCKTEKGCGQLKWEKLPIPRLSENAKHLKLVAANPESLHSRDENRTESPGESFFANSSSFGISSPMYPEPNVMNP